MGCLPIPLFSLLGLGLGYLIGGSHGAVWGAGIGLILGLGGMGWFIALVRRGHSRRAGERDGDKPTGPR